MTDFPTDIPLPSSLDWNPVDNAIKTPAEAGKVMSRRRYTSTRKAFSPKWSYISDANLVKFWTHYITVETYGTFSWSYDGTNFLTVRYTSPPTITKQPAGVNSMSLQIETIS